MNDILMKIVSPTTRVCFEVKNGQFLCDIIIYRYAGITNVYSGLGETTEMALRAAFEKWDTER